MRFANASKLTLCISQKLGWQGVLSFMAGRRRVFERFFNFVLRFFKVRVLNNKFKLIVSWVWDSNDLCY